MNRQGNALDIGMPFMNDADSINSFCAGLHLDVHQDNVRQERINELDSFCTILRSAYNRKLL